MQILNTLNKSLPKVVYFNRAFTVLLFVNYAIYLFQLTTDTNVLTIALLALSALFILFNLLFIEIIGSLLRKKVILTNETCNWIVKVITISITAVITVVTLATGNLFFASFYCIPIIIGNFIGDQNVKKITIFAVIVPLLSQYSTISINHLFINNIVTYAPASTVLASVVICCLILSHIISNTNKLAYEKTNLLQSMATTDVLTGLINRRHFDTRLREEISRSWRQRQSSNLSLALFDIDYFKKINDTYGHITGDKILRELGDIILKNTRECDICARYGGEEFALILPETNQIDAYELLERIRQLIETYVFCQDEMPVMISISVGIAQYDSEYSQKEFIEHADAALYQAKRTGRNKVVYGILTAPKLSIAKKQNYIDSVN